MDARIGVAKVCVVPVLTFQPLECVRDLPFDDDRVVRVVFQDRRFGGVDAVIAVRRVGNGVCLGGEDLHFYWVCGEEGRPYFQFGVTVSCVDAALPAVFAVRLPCVDWHTNGFRVLDDRATLISVRQLVRVGTRHDVQVEAM